MRIDINDYCTSEQAKKMFELKFAQTSEAYWVNDYVGTPWNKWYVTKSDFFGLSVKHYSAFDVSELNKMLGNYLKFCTSTTLLNEKIYIAVLPTTPKVFAAKREAHMKADLLIYLREIEEAIGLIKNPNLNSETITNKKLILKEDDVFFIPDCGGVIAVFDKIENLGFGEMIYVKKAYYKENAETFIFVNNSRKCIFNGDNIDRIRLATNDEKEFLK